MELELLCCTLIVGIAELSDDVRVRVIGDEQQI